MDLGPVLITACMCSLYCISFIEEYDDFEITTKTVHFQEGDGKKVKYVALKITDSHKSGINKHFRLCLTIGTTDWNETRAILTAHSKCIDITIMNTNCEYKTECMYMYCPTPYLSPHPLFLLSLSLSQWLDWCCSNHPIYSQGLANL